jgi:glycosyltransferase involved in cell wall biosynthesis
LLFTGERKIIARNVLASNMALLLKPFLKLKICFDGRGAIAAEWNEYDVVQIPGWKESISQWEKKSAINTDYRIAVSSELVNYWNLQYGYTQLNHVIIPCTLNSGFKATPLNEGAIKKVRAEFGFADDDIVLAYAGSTAGWQSFDMLKSILENVLTENKKCKVLFLSQNDKNVEQLQKEFPSRIFQKFVKHNEVTAILTACDYGILIREQSVTNKVASPTKFAEYLSAGLAVLISENIGDYTQFVKRNNCGLVVNDNDPIPLHKNSIQERNRFITLVATHYTKEANKENYLKLINEMNS